MNLNLLLANLIEKILRLESFLKEVSFVSSPQDEKFVTFFKDQLRSLKQLIIPSINEALSNDALTPRARQRILNTYFDVGLTFHLIHEQFRFFVSLPRIVPDIYTFISNIFPETKLIQIQPTVVYYYMYNFAEFNTLEYFGKIGTLLDPHSSDRVVLLVPYADFRNPLMWVDLAHEMGHAFEKEYRICESALPKIVTHFPRQSDIFRKWSKEIASDIIALRLGGPAYLSSFISYLILGPPTQYFISNTHPQPHHRISFMNDYLMTHHLSSDASTTYYNIFNELISFYAVTEFDLKALPYSITSNCYACYQNYTIDIPGLPVPFDGLVACLDEFIDGSLTAHGLTQYKETDHTIVGKLMEYLTLGVPISAYMTRTHEDIRRQLPCSSLETPESLKHNIYPLLELAEHNNADMKQIINTAWNNKVKSYTQEFGGIFTRSNVADTEKFGLYADYVFKFDRLIQKSIQTTKIHEIYKEG